jgi:DNA-binding transcriptional LysR family regulator
MKLTTIDLNLFVAFEAIYTERNLTRAAEILSVTQPAVSNSLSRLRALFDDPLFKRRGGAMAPTPVAQSLIGPVREALARLRSGLDQRVRFDPLTSDRTFHIAVRDTTASMLMPALAFRLQQVAPGLHVQSHLVERAEIPLELASGTLDFAIDIPQLSRSDLGSAPWIADWQVCVMRRGHPQADLAMTLERFIALPQVTISSRRRGKTLVEAALARLGKKANVVMRLPAFHLALEVVKASDLIVTAPHLAVQEHDVVVKDLPLPAPPQEMLLYWHRQADSDPGNLWMRGQLQDISAQFARASSEEVGTGSSKG